MPNLKIQDELVDIETLLSAVGNRNFDYYRRKWTSYDASGVPIFDWNWAALLFGWFWFAYRKLWVICLAYYALLFPLYEIVGRVAGGYAFIVTALAMKLFAVPMVANQLYFYYVKNRSAKFLETLESRTSLSIALGDRFKTVFDVTKSNPKVF